MRSKFIVIFIITLFVCSTSEARSLRGVWTSSSPDMVAYIYKYKIRIHYADKNNDALYWLGTFRSRMRENDVQRSKGNRKVMDAALLASGNKYKSFRYRNGSLSFWYSIFGVAQRVRLFPY